MKDVASLAGVSLATVSRVVNDNGDVRQDLAERVNRAVAILGYRRDVTASSLRRSDGLSASVGLVLEDVSNPFFSSLYRGVEDAARTRGVLAFAGSSDDDPDRERELCDAFAARRIDGLVIAPSGGEEGHLLRDRAAGVALVFVDRPPRSMEADTVLVDNAEGVASAVAHLVSAGHRRIAFMGDRQRIFTAGERLRGYREALSAHGIAAEPQLIRVDLADSGSAERAALDLLELACPPSALITGQNLITVGAVRALRALDAHHRVALIGFDDLVLADAVDPGLTVVRQDPVEIGRRAAELLFARIEGDRGPHRQVVLPTELVPRGSGEIPAAPGVRPRSRRPRG